MADVVQFRLERMVDELEDLERRGLFTSTEIAEVVRRRRDFEYRLRRPRPLKRDFLAYVDYEVQLDALRRIRKKKILGELKRRHHLQRGAEGEGKKKGGKLWKRSISDAAGVLRILEIYRLAAVRYKGDLQLWFRYLEFCRESRHGRMKQVLAQAIRFHPKVPGLWIYAAAWEFDQNLNVAAARALMQSGLRECPTSEDIWIEYLRMELTYLNKLKARKVALGEDASVFQKRKVETEETKKWKEENNDLFMPLDQGESVETEPQQGALKETENFFWKQGLNILRTIYRGAVEAIPSSMTLRKRFMDILGNADLAHSDELKEEVMEDIKKQFSNREEYWDWLARLDVCDVLKGKDLTKEEVICALKKAIQVYEDALHLIPTTEMFSLYAKCLSDVLFPEVDDKYWTFSKLGISAVEFASNFLGVLERAESCGCLTDDLAYQYISCYLKMGKLDEARKHAERLCKSHVSKAKKLWSLRITMEMKWITIKSISSTNDLNHVFDLLKFALNEVPIADTEFFWRLAIKFFSNRKEYFDKLIQIFTIQLAKGPGNDSGSSISSMIINSILQRDGVERARSMYRRFLALPRPGLAFMRYCIELESNLVFIGDSGALSNARKLFDTALGIYDENDDLWKDYYSFESKVGTSETANAVYWRCRKAQKDVTMLLRPRDS